MAIRKNKDRQKVHALRRIELGYRVGCFRLKKKLKQEDLASLVGLSRTSIVNIESGRQSIETVAIPDFCEALEITVVRLFKNIDK